MLIFIKAYLFCLVLCISSEVVNYYLFYRTEAFKNHKKTIILNKEKLKKEESDTSGNVAKKKKKIDALKAQLNLATSQGATYMIRSSIVSVLLQFVYMYIVGTVYDKTPVGKFPFTPFGLFQSLTHRGLDGDDYTQISCVFVFVMASVSTKAIIDMIFDFGLPKADTSKPEWMTNPEQFVDKWLNK
ncbi:hypothetical protein BB559_002563 [Furculomyces boomerangus]|uniref:Calcium load-activated calcium channel n=1 Tax=Furculomyces boomerangus TaxID=61424 RepID=A0A2T9YU79_9FUNG|nr:hypothetical protein BB559_002563 [Furculomyces boomerangus]